MSKSKLNNRPRKSVCLSLAAAMKVATDAHAAADQAVLAAVESGDEAGERSWEAEMALQEQVFEQIEQNFARARPETEQDAVVLLGMLWDHLSSINGHVQGGDTPRLHRQATAMTANLLCWMVTKAGSTPAELGLDAHASMKNIERFAAAARTADFSRPIEC